MKHKVKNSEDINDIDSSCTNDESEDGKNDTSHNDQYSDVSFEIDNDEDIDAAEIEEEDWVEYIEKERHWSYGKDGKWEDKMLEDDSQEKWNGDWRWASQHHRMRDGWSELLNGTQNSAQNTGPTDQMVDQAKDGKTTSTNSSNKLRRRLKIWLKAATISIKIGSTQQKTLEDGLYSKKTTQRIQLRDQEEILITDQRGTSMEWNWATKK